MSEVMDRIAAAAGSSSATRLAAEFGGQRIYIPARLPADHALCRLVGFEAAVAIRRELGPGHFDVPLPPAPATGDTARAVVSMTQAGLTARQIAGRLRCTMRTVYRHRRAARP